MKELDVANEYFNLANKGILDIMKILITLLEQKAIMVDKNMENKIMSYLKSFEEYCKLNNQDLLSINNLTLNDINQIKQYIEDKTNNDNEFTMPIFIAPQLLQDGSIDKNTTSYTMFISQKDMPKLEEMLKYFKEKDIKTDNIHLEDISIVNNPNNLFNAENVECNEIEFPLSEINIFNNIKNMLLSKGFEFNIAPHDNSVSIIYKRQDQNNILNLIFDKENKNSQVLFETNDTKVIDKYRELFTFKNDKKLNDRDSQKQALYDNGR